MSEKVLLSFVVPVYNVEKYLNECLDSIFDPSVSEDEYEVIAIDDGSTDSSPEILKSYTHHKNFRIITQENAGQGPARNAGIKAARGEYIGFVDSDDYLLPGAVPTLLGWARDSDCDIVEFEIESSDESLQKLDQIKPRTERTPVSGNGKTLFAEWHRQNMYLPSPCLCVCRRAFLIDNSLLFLSIVYEDAEWLPRCFFYAQKMIYHPVTIYHYRRRSGSTSSGSRGVKQYWRYIKLVSALNEFRKGIEQNEENMPFIRELGAMLHARLEWLINTIYKTVPREEKNAMINEIKKLKDVLILDTGRKKKRIYKFVRWLPAGIAIRIYKIF